MGATPRVSVVVPYWNGERTVGRALAAIVEESALVPLEIVVVDDGSDEVSAGHLREITGALPGCRIVTVPHGRVPAARNAGVAASAGEFVAFCDQDDQWLPGRLPVQLRALDEDPTLGFVAGRVEFALEEGCERPSWCRPQWLAESQPGTVLGALLVRRTAIEEIGPFDSSLVYAADDVEWFARARRLGVRARAIDRVVLRRWVHDVNASADPRGSSDLLAVVRHHARRSRGDGRAGSPDASASASAPAAERTR